MTHGDETLSMLGEVRFNRGLAARAGMDAVDHYLALSAEERQAFLKGLPEQDAIPDPVNLDPAYVEARHVYEDSLKRFDQTASTEVSPTDEIPLDALM